MPIVAMPDGVQVEFPDDMPKEQIRSLILQKFPDAGSKEAADHGLSERQKLSPLGRALSPITSYPETYQRMNKEAREQVSRGVEQLGGDTALDRAKGLGNVALGGIGYVASPINAAYRSVIGQPVEDVTGIPREYTEIAAQLATPGLGLPSIRGATPTIAPAPAMRPGQEVAAAAERLSQTGAPVQIPRAAASDNMAVQQAGAVTSNVPYAGTPLVKAAERTIDQLGTKADEVSQAYGGGATVSQAGEGAKSAIRDWITGESAQTSKKLYDKVDSLINPDVKTPLDATRGVVAEIAAKRDAAALSSGKATQAVLEAVQRADGLTYEGVKTLRTNIGEMLNGSILPEGVSGAELKRIYGALSEDLKTSVSASGGPQAEMAFERANRYSRLANERRESLAKIVGTDGNAPAESVFNRIQAMAGSTARADVAKLAQARKAIGSADWNEVASTLVSRLGRDVEGNFSPERFVTAYGKLSESGKNILFRSSEKSNLADHLNDIAQVSSRFKQLQKFANPSGSGRAVIGGSIGPALYAAPLTTISTLAGNFALASALSRPATAASIAKLSKAQFALATSPAPSKVGAYMLAARNLISTMELKAVTPADFLKALQGPVPARAENEQT